MRMSNKAYDAEQSRMFDEVRHGSMWIQDIVQCEIHDHPSETLHVTS